MIEFNGMSTSLELFYAKGFGNCVHSYVLCIFRVFLAHGYMVLSIPRPLLRRLAFVPDRVSKSMADSRPKGPGFGWATFGWASCNINTFIPYV